MPGDLPIQSLPAGTETSGAEVKESDTPSTQLAHEFGDEFGIVVETDPNPDGKTTEREDLAKKTNEQGKEVSTEEKKPEPPTKEEVKTEQVSEDEIVPKVDAKNLPPVAISETVVDDKGTVTETPELRAQYDNLKKEYDAKVQEVETLKAVAVSLEELKRDPPAFVARFFPELAAKITPHDIVVQTLQKEFGAELASYSEAEALQEGTLSYKIQQRRDAIREQVQRSKLEGDAIRLDEARRREAKLAESKAKVMTTYKLSEDQFNQEIVNWSKQNPIDWEIVAKLRYFDYHIQHAVKEALGRRKGRNDKLPASVAGVSGRDDSPDAASKGFKEFRDEFGD